MQICDSEQHLYGVLKRACAACPTSAAGEPKEDSRLSPWRADIAAREAVPPPEGVGGPAAWEEEDWEGSALYAPSRGCGVPVVGCGYVPSASGSGMASAATGCISLKRYDVT
jgi:hypothetical protein